MPVHALKYIAHGACCIVSSGKHHPWTRKRFHWHELILDSWNCITTLCWPFQAVSVKQSMWKEITIRMVVFTVVHIIKKIYIVENLWGLAVSITVILLTTQFWQLEVNHSGYLSRSMMGRIIDMACQLCDVVCKLLLLRNV